jgi:arginine decarboxylase
VSEAERLASKTFGARRTFFCTNGTSSANRIVLEALLRSGDKALLDRACHQSVHDAMITTGAAPVYLECTYNCRYGLHGPVPRSAIEAALQRHSDATVLVLTSCTYDGLRYDLTPIISAAHTHGIKVLVDEAWYAHARFHPAFRPTALECGADYVTQSAHKTLCALSQGSMIHVNDIDFDEHRFEEVRRMHASSSPQYALIASLDIARRQAQMEGYAMLSRTLELAIEVRERIAALPGLRCVTLDDLLESSVRDDRILLDPTKITLEVSGNGHAAARLRRVLREVHHIQVEKHTSNTLSLLMTMSTTPDQVERLIRALSSLEDEVSTLESTAPPALVPFSELACLPREAFHARGLYLPVYDASGMANTALVGRVCADQIVFYPPGIPVLVPGQVITSDAVVAVAIAARGEERYSLHGVASVCNAPAIRVVA